MEGFDVLRCEGNKGSGVEGVDAGCWDPVAGYVLPLNQLSKEGVVAKFPSRDVRLVGEDVWLAVASILSVPS